jgi:hypothetical protein
MRNFVQVTTVVFTLVLGAGLVPNAALRSARAADSTAADAAVTRPDMKKLGMHLRDHQKYPATREELLASCNELVDFSDGEKRWFADHLPEGTYKSAGQVLKALRK